LPLAALPRPVVFLRKGAASVRGRLLVNPRCEYCASALLPAQCRFAAWAGGGTTTTCFTTEPLELLTQGAFYSRVCCSSVFCSGLFGLSVVCSEGLLCFL